MAALSTTARRLVSLCLPLLLECATIVSFLCRLCAARERSAATKADAQRVSGVERIPGGKRSATPGRATSAAGIEFSIVGCAVEKRSGAASEATRMSGRGQVGGPSLPPMCPTVRRHRW
jgi:hypothetical protein